MSDYQARQTSEIDGTDRPEPAKKNRTVKAVVKPAKEILKNHKGWFAVFDKPKIIVNPDQKLPSIHNQPNLMSERNNKLGEYLMHTYASLIKEVEPVVLSENAKTFLELTAHKHGLIYEEIEEIFKEGVEYWHTTDDEERTPEEYGIAFVNRAILNEKKGGMFAPAKSDVEKNLEKYGKLNDRESINKKKEGFNAPRVSAGYTPAAGKVSSGSGYRYKVTIDSGKYVFPHEVNAADPEEAAEIAMRRHEKFVEGRKKRKGENWEIAEIKTIAAPRPDGVVVLKKRKKRIPQEKAKTRIGKIAHWFGQASVDIDNAPKPKRGSKKSSKRRRSSSRSQSQPQTQQHDSAPRQLEYHPSDED